MSKRQCKFCTMTMIRDRPVLCVQFECNHYTPCTRCQMNRILDVNGLCNVCVANDRSPTAKAKAKAPFVELNEDGDLQETTQELKEALENDLDTSQIPPARKLSVSLPGTPPAEYDNNEKEMYLIQWNEYQGFYRDPTAKSVVHGIIILEIELNWLFNQMISNRGNPNKSVEQQRTRLIRSLKELHDQLPKREANDESDDERFLSMVYQKYTEEMHDRRIGKVSRLLSPQAIALAPVLHFKLNPKQLLIDLGYRPVDAAEACSHILLDDLPKDPQKALEFFGFFLQEKYALPIETEIPYDEDEENLPAVANPQESRDPEKVDNDEPA